MKFTPLSACEAEYPCEQSKKDNNLLVISGINRFKPLITIYLFKYEIYKMLTMELYKILYIKLFKILYIKLFKILHIKIFIILHMKLFKIITF